MSKHQHIINYILSLEVGTKISVRGISGTLNISEGIAYRAIKECETMGVVKTIPRAGTIRVDKISKKNNTKLSFNDVLNIVDGSLIGGEQGINKTLEKFIIGAMEISTIKKYLQPGCLIIVGNREEAQKIALNNQCAVLITGGFTCSETIKELADKKKLPVIMCGYDTFTVASLINKAIHDNNVKKEIVLVEDIMKTEPIFLYSKDSILRLKELIKTTGHERYPVVDDNEKVVGMVTPGEIAEASGKTISEIMVKNPICLEPSSTVAYAAHIFAWEGIKLCPVVVKKRLVGVISREDIIKSMQMVLTQPHMTETLDDKILKCFKYEVEENKIHFSGKILPEMVDSMGTASWSALNMILSTIGVFAMKKQCGSSIAVDSFSSYFITPIQVGKEVDVYIDTLEMGRKYGKVDIVMNNSTGDIVAKAIMSFKVLMK